MSSSSAERLAESASPEPSLFVINLCASTTPMALVHPSNPELKRFTFFVTRQREEGRERFRLHMGYFASLFEAETLLGAVRDVYPAAWAGPAPSSGMSRRPRVTAPLSAPVTAPVAAPMIDTPALDTPALVASVLDTSPESSPMPAVAATDAATSAPVMALEAMSNVRDVLAQLSDDSRHRPLSESQTLRMLERPDAAAKKAPVPVANDIAQVRFVTPEDTQTLRDIRLDAERNAPPCFAVQLIWSVTPITITDLPHLAIFDAYTLYNVEGSREGRKWFGLRLGFFTDPNAAAQVAAYIRSDYPTVAVVPVAEKERDGAREPEPVALKQASNTPVQKPREQVLLEPEGLAGFELLRDDRPAPAKRDVGEAPAGVKIPVVRAATAPAPTLAIKMPAKTTGKRVAVRKPPGGRVTPGAAMPLEETLEILGASTLTIDEGREVINDSAVRKPASLRKKSAGGRFSRLLNRLGGG